MARIFQVVKEEMMGVRPRLWAMNAVARLTPNGVASRLRGLVYRAFGLSIGKGTICNSPLNFGWYGEVFRNLSIGAHCFFNRDVFIDTTARVSIGSNTAVGHDVAIVTASHDPRDPFYRAGTVSPKPISIGSGVWICARVVILPGVTIGDGAIVGAGSVVSRDVPPHTFAAGAPARVIKHLNEANSFVRELETLVKS